MTQKHDVLYKNANLTVRFLTPEVLARIGIAGTANTWYQNEFISKYNTFKTAFVNWLNPAERTPTKSTILYKAEADFKKVYRQLYTGYLKGNPLVTDDDLQGAAFPKRSSGRRRHSSLPDTRVGTRTDTSKPALVIIHYFDLESHGAAKPPGVHGAEIVWAVLDHPPVDWSELTHSEFSTRTPLSLSFSGEQRGLTLYFAMRWENTRGEKGPWSNIESVIIP
jgi:hypothetical protein